MAGRGTDIKLGGNKDFVQDGIINDIDEYKKNESKVNLGVYMIERKDTKVGELTISLEVDLEDKEIRFNNFFISLQDELMRIF